MDSRRVFILNTSGMQKIDHIVNLLKDYLTGDLDAQRTAEVERTFEEYPHLRQMVKELDSEEGLQNALNTYEELFTEAFQQREERILSEVLTRIKKTPSRSGIHAIRKNVLIYSSVAAVAIMVLFAAVFLIQKNEEPAYTEEIASSFTPGRNKASLTLSNGQQIDLSDAYAGIIVDGQIGYDDGSPLFDGRVEEYTMLTLATPRGGQYQVTLSDGTKVWLNAESKLHYPSRFSEEIRHVQLEGEGYFEVAHRENIPFIVATAREKVEVLGTHFNINSYQTDMRSTVALLEGKVKVSSGDHAATVLKPGQQTVVADGKMEVQTIDIEESIAWKNGEFMFNNETLPSVMKKLARWYDLDIDVSPELKDSEIWGSVSRYDNFNTVLKLIKMTDDSIRFEIEGRRVRFVK